MEQPARQRPNRDPVPIRCLAALVPPLLALPACGHIVDAPRSSAPVPFVEGILVPGMIPALKAGLVDPATPSGTTAASSVELRLRGPDGHWVRLASAGPAAYTVDMPVAAGATYELAGTIDGIPIAATTRIPTSFAVVEPALDTVRATTGPFGVAEIRYRFAAPDAGAFLADSATFDTGEPLSRYPAGRVLLLGRPAGSPAGPVIRFLALNHDAARYLAGPTPTGNLAGGFGMLGGALARDLVVAWTPR